MLTTKMASWVLALGMCAVSLCGQVINTVAGTNWSFPTSSVPTLSAPLGFLSGVAIDAQGNLYAPDESNEIVVRISPNGLAVIAGNVNLWVGFSGDGGLALQAQLGSAYGPAGAG